MPEPFFECVEKGVNLTCSPMSNSDVVVSWIQNGMKSKGTLAFLQCILSVHLSSNQEIVYHA